MPLRSIRVGLDALGSNPLRTLLSTSGVVIGVAALVAVLSLGDGIERYARDQIERTTDIQFIEVAPRTVVTVDGVRLPGTSFPSFTPADAQALAHALPGVSQVRLALTGSGRLLARDTVRAAIVVASYTWPEATAVTVSGRPLTAEDQRGDRRIAVVSARAARLLDGDSLVLEGAAWPVVGVMPDQAGDSILRIMVPLGSATAAMVPSEWPRAPALLVRAAHVEDVERVRTDVERWLAARNPAWPRGVTLNTNTGRVRQARQGALVFKLFLWAPSRESRCWSAASAS
jgi:putative ABC transport system permease protein